MDSVISVRRNDVDIDLLVNVAQRSTPALFRRLFSSWPWAEWERAFGPLLQIEGEVVSYRRRLLSLKLPHGRRLTEIEADNLRELASLLQIPVEVVLVDCDLRLPLLR